MMRSFDHDGLSLSFRDEGLARCFSSSTGSVQTQINPLKL